MLTTFLLVVHSLLAVALVTVILMQKSEGGGFTGGGSASGNLVSARGVGDMLSRTTAILAALFIITSLTLAWRASHSNAPSGIDTSLARQAPAESAAGGQDAVPAETDAGNAAPLANDALMGVVPVAD